MNNNLITVKEVAEIIGIGQFRIYEWVRENKIPFLKTVGQIRFDPDEIEKWLKRHREESKSEI